MSNLPMIEEVGVEAEFVSVTVGYLDPLLFPVDQGLQFIKSLRNCLSMTSEGYGDERIQKIERFDKEIKVRFHTEEEIKEIIASTNLLLRNKDKVDV